MTNIKPVKRYETLPKAEPEATMQPVIGLLSGSSEAGAILVQFGDSGPKAARNLAGTSRSELMDPGNIGRQVLLLFENNDPGRPIIVGMIASPLEDLVSMEVKPQAVQEKLPVEAKIDDKRIVLEAENEIELRCGKGSITIRKDGKIVIKGTHLLSRSSGPHRIKGGNVAIN